MAHERTLVLNATFEPLAVISAEEAMTLWAKDRVQVLEEHPRVARAVNFEFKWPSVVRLREYVKLKRRPVVQFTRNNVYVRDEFTCQYCTSPETAILAADLTWRLAKDITVGSTLVGVDEYPLGKGAWRKLREAQATAVKHFVGARVRVVTDRGSIVVSPDHKFLSAQGASGRLDWVAATALVPGVAIKFHAQPWTDRADSWLAGIIDGEANLRVRQGNCYLVIAQNEGPVLDRIKRELTALSVAFTQSLVDKKKSVRCFRVCVFGVQDVSFLLGTLRPTRLIDRSAELLLGQTGLGKNSDALVTAVEPLPDGPLVGITTSTSTLITDGYVSHNCGEAHEPDRLTFDHVVPVAQGGTRSWHNIVAACRPCNHKKGARTPREAGMREQTPRRPPVLAPNMKFSNYYRAPQEWKKYLQPKGAETDADGFTVGA